MSIRIREYKFFRSLSVKVNDNWPVRKAEQLWKQLRAHKIAEIEATEACKWLRAAGFPQYAQMYEDQQFPVDVNAAELDHPMLEPSVLKSLFRRLHALNKCARVHQQRVTHTDDSEDEQCALSYNWTYQSDLRRWSRIGQNLEIPGNIEEWSSGISAEKPECSGISTEPTRSRLRRMGSTRHHRRSNRDVVVMSESGSNVLDFLSKHFNSMSSTDASACASASVSNSEGTLDKKKKSRSLDKSDGWSYSPHHERIPWNPITHTEEDDESRLDLEEGGRPISTLSCTQLQVLRKLALLKLTALMEKYCPTHRTGWNWDLPKLIRKIKTPAYKDKSVFGVPLTIILQRTGSSLPKGIEEALQWLQQNSYDQVGLFRKSGVKSRIQHLKSLIETQGEFLNFSEYHAYDIADMVKQYFRDLPEALLTNKLSETFLLIFQFVPDEERRQAVLCALLLMPDEHCEVLLALLKFLTNIAEHSAINQMNESNLAICFAPSLFFYNIIPSNRQGLGSPHPRELAESKAAQDCLLYFLQNCNNLFSIPKEILKQCTSNEMKESIPVMLSDLGSVCGGWRGYLDECQKMLLREVKEKGWMMVHNHYSKVEIAYKKVTDGHPLRLWKISADIEAPPAEVFYRILRERPKWDEELHSTKTIAQIDRCAEVFQYTLRNVPPLPLKDYCVVRSWRTDLAKGACLIVETSVEHSDAINIPNSVRGIVLASRYLIEPCGSGKSRLVHLCRVDTRGRMPEWYHKNYGHICALYVANIQSSFKQFATGPESKV
ncbi:PREDICTED: stAR-related lipid transfer protein 13 isoform X2 [Nicrophorus vespilloides]|uniref:StAR-related lipid transfer protein 13 isoform X2 n=1 Tax=Nicrophorus vespilloides TaxID=110193 RepID=A0ABM1NAM9_NICVS|nr:PREDICTED: stAR-related lipid transfer protein 13 isoform X2 [Nicrophorus vespilloides]